MFFFFHRSIDLTNGGQIDNFYYLTHPQSFKACLDQLNQETFKAFLTAHSSMQRIGLFSQKIEGYIKDAIKFMYKVCKYYYFAKLKTNSYLL